LDAKEICPGDKQASEEVTTTGALPGNSQPDFP
jgi:hypothetical protein